jgi:hypothetical protein
MSNPEGYTVGWICALSTETVAAREFLDEEHPTLNYQHPQDNNSYTLGRVGKHNVVIAVLPNGQYGISSAAGVVKDMLHSFQKIRICLMVGVGGGAPSGKHDMRLGDIVVSTPGNGHSGVLQYGKAMQNEGFKITGALNNPPAILLTAVNALKARYEADGHNIEELIDQIFRRKTRLQRKYRRPKPESDRLYVPILVHPSDGNKGCATACGDDPQNLIR